MMTAAVPGTNADQIIHFKERFRSEVFGQIILICQKDELEQQIAERQRKLENAALDEVKKTQGEIAGLRLAIEKIGLKP
mgnify:CR=1 FL=1